MKFKKIEGSLAIYVLIFNSGDEVRAGLNHLGAFLIVQMRE